MVLEDESMDDRLDSRLEWCVFVPCPVVALILKAAVADPALSRGSGPVYCPRVSRAPEDADDDDE